MTYTCKKSHCTMQVVTSLFAWTNDIEGPTVLFFIVQLHRLALMKRYGCSRSLKHKKTTLIEQPRSLLLIELFNFVNKLSQHIMVGKCTNNIEIIAQQLCCSHNIVYSCKQPRTSCTFWNVHVATLINYGTESSTSFFGSPTRKMVYNSDCIYSLKRGRIYSLGMAHNLQKRPFTLCMFELGFW